MRSRDISTYRDQLLEGDSSSEKTMNNEVGDVKHSFEEGDERQVEQFRAQAYDVMSADLDLSVDSVDLAMITDKNTPKRAGSAGTAMRKDGQADASKGLFYEIRSQKQTE